MPYINPRPDLSLADPEMRNVLNDFIYAAEQQLAGNINAIARRIYRLNVYEAHKPLWSNVYCYALQMAAEHGYNEVVGCLTGYGFPISVDNSKRAHRLALQTAVENGHEEVVRLIISSSAILSDNFKEIGSKALRYALQNGHIAVVNGLLRWPVIFEYAEINHQLFGDYLRPVIEDRLARLEVRRQRFQNTNPDGVFDIGSIEIRITFHILRSLIRRNEASLITLIRQLLKLPSLAQRLHLTMYGGRRNELYRLSIEIHNELASAALLELPNVHAEAVRHLFYANNQEVDALGLQEAVGNHESSVRALYPGEQRIVTAVKAHYLGMMQERGGVGEVLKALKAYLRGLYDEVPATVKVGDQTQSLPFEWDDFTRLRITLSDAEQRLALQAYYQHATHTAHRFLSNPNPWIRPGWSSHYAMHSDLIAYFWLAASDDKAPVTDRQPVAARQHFFVNSLALIVRAHNWHKTRHRKDALGALMYDGHRQAIMEEYDNLMDDAPSCPAGTALRLFQAVTGHPLFVYLTMSLLQQELAERIRAHFETLLLTKTDGEKQAINRAIANEVIFMEPPSARLKALDISSSQKQAWIDELSVKYGVDFDETSEFLAYVYKLIDITPDKAHITQFYTSHNLGPLLGPLPELNDSCFVEEIATPPVTPTPIVLVAKVDNYIVRCGRFNLLLAPDVTSLDLSASGFNELDPIEMNQLFRQLSYLPETVTSISFRNNGFQGTEERTKAAYRAFTEALRFIPTSVTTLDLRDNGFECYTREELKAFFSCFPKTVQLVSLVNGEALSIAIQLERLHWPESYYKLAAKGRGNFLDIAREILDDYTKGNNVFLRMLMLHWNRHHIDSVAAIVEALDKPTPTYHNAEELIATLATLKIDNHCGSLARRFTFLSHHPSRSAPPHSAAVLAAGQPVVVEMVDMSPQR